MRKYSALYYLLFVLIIMGAFASMAQNSYGLKIVGVACLGFALTFLNEIFFPSQTDGKLPYPSWLIYFELLSLTVIAVVFSLKNFFSFDSVFFNPLLISSMVVVMFLLLYQAVTYIKVLGGKETMLLVTVVLYYASVLVFILSFLISILLPDLVTAFAVAGILLTVGFVTAALISKRVSYGGETITMWHYIGLLKNKSSILLITCILVYGYHLLYSAGTLPPLYHGAFPEGYRQLVNMSVTTNDHQKPQLFKARYEEFVGKYSSNLDSQ